MDDYCIKRPDSFGAKRYQMISSSFNADRTWSSIKFIAANALQVFEFDAARKMLTKKKRFDIRQLGKEKTALFLNISDTDRSLDMLAGIFYSQALNVLCTQADRNPNSKLDVPVKLCLDDFASNCYISDFEKMMSVVRSRDISISCIVQSLSQLNAYYGEARASTIIDNADLLYYMGCQDLASANFISQRANIPLENVLALKSDQGILFRRGEKPLTVTKIAPYSMMPIDEEQFSFDDDEPQTEQAAPKGTAL
jgi:type IV secretion system protein VirD4